MKIDLDSIKNKLLNNQTSLVDPRILLEDMYPMWEYATLTNDYKSCVKQYCETNSEFDLLEFSKAYLSDVVEIPVSLSYTEDNYILISL